MQVFASATKTSSSKDTNPVMSPCAQLQPIGTGDAITVAVALGGNRATWHNNSNSKLNVLSPCSPHTSPGIPLGTQVTVFRPIVDQLSLFQIYNQTLTSVATTFSEAASLLVYAGYNSATDNGTIVSEPRTFSTSVGKIGGLLLVMEFEQGVLKNLTWKDDDCRDCGNSSVLCLDNNCATPIATCISQNTTNPAICITRINVAYSGTDKNSLSFTSWMSVKQVTKYSLSALYFKADEALQSGIQGIIDRGNQVGTGGQV
ncbi:uncharacterized protein [Physcomitrium patens]|uniref:Uncharacterized protein n=1 Tax=Physcomitrium patens TaxID=3218 RepID=A0A2K1IVJ5_PHYPA|nr:uncharacterized protein LOC112273096 isoform X2 [Physcomitrium patens]PNR33303.1 hypothetical protein PHYPA_025246 [Physcomitrium patens]|eukprot:XP_024357260.1 uncharacterized protein LOC112273096 isoform X2 [Physcomitrella patens]